MGAAVYLFRCRSSPPSLSLPRSSLLLFPLCLPLSPLCSSSLRLLVCFLSVCCCPGLVCSSSFSLSLPSPLFLLLCSLPSFGFLLLVCFCPLVPLLAFLPVLSSFWFSAFLPSSLSLFAFLLFLLSSPPSPSQMPRGICCCSSDLRPQNQTSRQLRPRCEGTRAPMYDTPRV